MSSEVGTLTLMEQMKSQRFTGKCSFELNIVLNTVLLPDRHWIGEKLVTSEVPVETSYTVAPVKTYIPFAQINAQ